MKVTGHLIGRQILMNIAVLFSNIPPGRTPGTVDILDDASTTLGDAVNEGTIIIRTGGELILEGNCINRGLISMQEGSILRESGTLLNERVGLVEIEEDADVLGDGLVENVGDINQFDGSRRTVGHTLWEPELVNITDSTGTGVFTVNGDTVEFVVDVLNNGDFISSSSSVVALQDTFWNQSNGLIAGEG